MYYSHDELKQIAQEEWDCIIIDGINDLIDSTASRVKALVIADRGYTKY